MALSFPTQKHWSWSVTRRVIAEQDYYCDPYSSYQKPNVELNHEFIRKILPKRKSFDELEQSDISLMMSHINSYSREKQDTSKPDIT